MTRRSDSLRAGLDAIAGRSQPVDLYERSLARSRQIGRRRALASATTAAVAVILVTLGTWRLVPRTDAVPPPPASPSATATARPTATPRPSGSATPSPSVAPVPPANLANETLDVPAWPQRGGVGACPTRFQLSQGKAAFAQGSIEVRLVKSLAIDLNSDAVTETVAFLTCRGPSEGGVQQVVAYRGAAGALVVVGQVVGSIPDLGSDLSYVEDVASAGAAVRVEVANGPQGSAPPTYYRVHQWRTFAWTGTTFAQTAGSTSFLADPSVSPLSVTPGQVVVPAGTGCVTATLTLKVHNAGPRAAGAVTVAVMHPYLDQNDCPQVPASQGFQSSLADLGTVAAGQTKTVTLTIVHRANAADSGTTNTSAYNYVELRIGDQRYADRVTYTVRFG